MSRRSAQLSFDGHQITIYHSAGRERVVEPGFCIVADDREWSLCAIREDAVLPGQTVIQHGATAEQWEAAQAEYERRSAR